MHVQGLALVIGFCLVGGLVVAYVPDPTEFFKRKKTDHAREN